MEADDRALRAVALGREDDREAGRDVAVDVDPLRDRAAAADAQHEVELLVPVARGIPWPSRRRCSSGPRPTKTWGLGRKSSVGMTPNANALSVDVSAPRRLFLREPNGIGTIVIPSRILLPALAAAAGLAARAVGGVAAGSGAGGGGGALRSRERRRQQARHAEHHRTERFDRHGILRRRRSLGCRRCGSAKMLFTARRGSGAGRSDAGSNRAPCRRSACRRPRTPRRDAPGSRR